MALGAQRGQVLWIILRESFFVTGVAVLAGVPLATSGSRLMRSMQATHVLAAKYNDWAAESIVMNLLYRTG